MSLEVKNLTKSYGSKTVVDNLSFELKEPGVYALLGTNGAGKTTSIRMILGMLAKDSGEVLWNGKPMDAMNMSVVLGTIAGDDTVFIVMRDNNSAAAFCGEIKSLLS